MKINTSNFFDQKPGTSGLRKKTRVFQQINYVENYVQSIFNVINIKNKSFILGGDGRYYNKEVLHKIIAMAIANKAKKIYIAIDGLLSTPATSICIRELKLDLGIILSASHNPAGIDGDFGIKINNSSGAPLNFSFTEKIFEETKKIEYFHIYNNYKNIDISKEVNFTIQETEIEVLNTVDIYTNTMKSIFDFEKINSLIKNGFNFHFNAIHGVTGNYAYNIFHKELSVPKENLHNIKTLENFGNLNPDPNPVTAKFFVDKVKNLKNVDLAALCDADGDRNFIFTPKYNIESSDSMAIILNNHSLIDYYKNIKGIARSKATPKAVDDVAKYMNIPCFETPTGWKFFENLMEANLIDLCVEESFGLGSSHSREKDGIWAILAWLHIIAISGKSANQLIEELWLSYGKYFYTRLDYEKLSEENINSVLNSINNTCSNFSDKNITVCNDYKITDYDIYNYTDITTNETIKNQGISITLNNLSLFIRVSGTSTEGSTIRIYCQIHSKDTKVIFMDKNIIFSNIENIISTLSNNTLTKTNFIL